MVFDASAFKDWIGRSEAVDDLLPPVPAACLAATLVRDTPVQGEPLPPLWHWIYFLSIQPQTEIAEDGHTRRGGFVPPVPLPRRMFAGADIRFHRPLRLGRLARRVSVIEDLTPKSGRTGALVFLRIRVEVSDADGLVLTETQDIVYREAPGPGESPRRAPPALVPQWRETIRPGVALLFRYSALIFNAHRIHFDRPYATEHEGYGGLVVHGQLVATMLAGLAERNVPGRMTSFRFRATRPIVDTAPFSVCGTRSGRSVLLWAEDETNSIAMEATAEFDG